VRVEEEERWAGNPGGLQGEKRKNEGDRAVFESGVSNKARKKRGIVDKRPGRGTKRGGERGAGGATRGGAGGDRRVTRV